MAPESPDRRTKTRSYSGRARSRQEASTSKGTGKSRFPAVAGYWGRVNSGGDFESAAASAVFPARPPRRLPVAGLKWLLPYLGSALVGALTALAVSGVRTAAAPPAATVPAVATTPRIAAPAAVPAASPAVATPSPPIAVPLPASLAPSGAASTSEPTVAPQRPRARPASVPSRRRPPPSPAAPVRAVPLDDGVLEPSFR